jgi:hypothetical protein
LRKHAPRFAFIFLVVLLAFVLQPIHTLAAPSSSLQLDTHIIRNNDLSDYCQSLGGDNETLLSRHVRSRFDLSAFVASVARAEPATVIGVFVCRVLALDVAQQPVDNPVFVSEIPGTATQFRLAAGYGTIGLLAHSERAGARFFGLVAGQEVNIVYGDGSIKRFVVSEIRHMRSVKPDDPYSDFLDLEHDGNRLSSEQVFNQVFAKSERVVFQTCIEREGNPSWGRLFVTATREFEDYD